MANIPIRKIKATLQEPDLSASFSIRDISELLAGNDMVQELHRHDFFYVLALQKGAGSHSIDFVPYEVSDNALFFMRPGQVHRLLLKTGSTGYLMAFKTGVYYPNDKASRQLLRKAGNRNHYVLAADRCQQLHSTLTHIFQEYSGQQEGFQRVIRANLDIFLTGLVRQQDKSGQDKTNRYPQERLEEFLDLLENDISHHKQVSEYAGMMSLSPYQLNAITKTMLGKTCSEVINDVIILESKRQLLATSDQVGQIAYRLGYEDASYFIRFFRKHTGYSPEAFRQNFS